MAERAALTCDEFLDLAATVALDAADPEDSRRVEEHAAACPDCGRQLSNFREVAAALGARVPQVEPPAALRRRVLEAVGRTAQEPPSVSTRLPRRRHFSPAWLAAAASLVLSVAALAWAATLQTQIGTLQNEAQAARERAAHYDQILGGIATQRLAVRSLQPASMTLGSRGMVYLDPDSGTGMVLCQNLPPVDQGRAYQVWFVRGNERVSGGLLWPDGYGNGYTLIQVPKDLQSFEWIGLTDEPGTGSAWPTTPRVIGTPLKDDT